MGGSKNKLEMVVDVTPENLTVSTCENLQWQLHCVEVVALNMSVHVHLSKQACVAPNALCLDGQWF